jgi:hypothetical protein
MSAKLRREPITDSFNMRLPTSLRRALERAAEREDRTPSNIVRRLLTVHLRADGELATSTQ